MYILYLYIDVDVDMDIGSDMAVSLNWEVLLAEFLEKA